MCKIELKAANDRSIIKYQCARCAHFPVNSAYSRT